MTWSTPVAEMALIAWDPDAWADIPIWRAQSAACCVYRRRRAVPFVGSQRRGAGRKNVGFVSVSG
jgi:hypothetical protein